MLRFNNANSYATRKNAITKLTKFVNDSLGKSLEAYHWIIVAQEDGRFSPMVMLHGEQSIEAVIFANNGICVMG